MLSGGEKQKIACGSAATIEPDLFVLDEPTSNLDAIGIRGLREAVKHWKSQEKTIVIAEHRIFWIADLCDRAYFLQESRIKKEVAGCELINKTTQR